MARVREQGGPDQSLLTGSVHYTLAGFAVIQASGFRAKSSSDTDYGAFVAVNLPLGSDRTATGGLDASAGGTSVFAEVRQQERLEPGATAWRIRAAAGERSDLEGEVVHRSRLGRIGGYASIERGGARLEARMDGALVFMGAPMLASDRIDAAFAVVDVGAPDVEVHHQNRPIGRSDRRGRLIATNLQPYEPNAISIDVDGLPIHLFASTTTRAVSPPYGAGARVRFGIEPTGAPIAIALQLPDGRPAPAGAIARVAGETLVVGYDGLLFLPSPMAEALVEVDLGDGASCQARVTINAEAKGLTDALDALCT
jgi:outer membrane usher protein